MRVAIVGYIGVGKSTAAGVFGEHGYELLHADEVGHELLDRLEILEKVRALFGLGILGRNLKIDKAKLSKAAFVSETSLRKLSAIIHPYLKEELKSRVEATSGNIIIDSALFGKLGIPAFSDKTLLITSDIENVYSRLAPKYTKREILNAMNNQEIIAGPDYTIENNGTIEEFQAKITQLISEITAEK